MTHRIRACGPAVALAAATIASAALLAGCSSGGSSASTGASASGGFAGRLARVRPVRARPGSDSAGARSADSDSAGPVAGVPVPHAAPGRAASSTARLLPAQGIIYTASLTVQAGDVVSAAQQAVAIVTAAGGYPASETQSSQPGRGHPVASARLQLKIPVAAYPAALGQLRTRLGQLTAISQQAQDVTEEVADVTSRVTSAQAGIAQLRTLLRRAGSVASLLSVQNQINAQESALEELQAQQRALAGETTYATVSLLLASHHRASVARPKKTGHGFAAGLRAGWRGLRLATTWLLDAIGTVLPFAIIIALAGGIGYAGRRRRLRRKSGPTATG